MCYVKLRLCSSCSCLYLSRNKGDDVIVFHTFISRKTLETQVRSLRETVKTNIPDCLTFKQWACTLILYPCVTQISSSFSYLTAKEMH